MNSSCLCPPGPNPARFRATLLCKAWFWCSPGQQGVKPGQGAGPGRIFGWLLPMLTCRFMAHCVVDSWPSWACPWPPYGQAGCKKTWKIPQAAQSHLYLGVTPGGEEMNHQMNHSFLLQHKPGWFYAKQINNLIFFFNLLFYYMSLIFAQKALRLNNVSWGLSGWGPY